MTKRTYKQHLEYHKSESFFFLDKFNEEYTNTVTKKVIRKMTQHDMGKAIINNPASLDLIVKFRLPKRRTIEKIVDQEILVYIARFRPEVILHRITDPSYRTLIKLLAGK